MKCDHIKEFLCFCESVLKTVIKKLVLRNTLERRVDITIMPSVKVDTK